MTVSKGIIAYACYSLRYGCRLQFVTFCEGLVGDGRQASGQCNGGEATCREVPIIGNNGCTAEVEMLQAAVVAHVCARVNVATHLPDGVYVGIVDVASHLQILYAVFAEAVEHIVERASCLHMNAHRFCYQGFGVKLCDPVQVAPSVF